MSATESHDESPATDSHGNVDPAHGHPSDEDILGPIDWLAWGAGIAGVAIALVMWLCFVQATSVAVGS